MRRYLSANETLALVARHHWLVLWKPALQMLAAFVVAYVLGGAAGNNGFTQTVWVVWLLFFLRFGWCMLVWYDDRIAVTDKRLFKVNGIFVRSVASMPLRKVTDMTYRRTVPGRLLGYGEVIVESAGQDQALGHIKYIADPDDFYRIVTAQVFGGRVPAGGRRDRGDD